MEEKGNENGGDVLLFWQTQRETNSKIADGHLFYKSSNSWILWRVLARLKDAGMKTDAPLRKHAYSNILKILQPRNENFRKKKNKKIKK